MLGITLIFDDNEVTLSATEDVDDDDLYDGADDEAYTAIMNADCYFAAGASLLNIGGMTADIIANDDEEVIYVKLTSTIGYSDDVSGDLYTHDDLEVDDDAVDAADADFATFTADNSVAGYDYAKNLLQ